MGWASGEVVLPKYPGDWVLVKELSLCYHNKESLLFTSVTTATPRTDDSAGDKENELQQSD